MSLPVPPSLSLSSEFAPPLSFKRHSRCVMRPPKVASLDQAPAKFADPTADGSCPNTGPALVATILRVFPAQIFPPFFLFFSPPSSSPYHVSSVSLLSFPLFASSSASPSRSLHLDISIASSLQSRPLADRHRHRPQSTSEKYPMAAPGAPENHTSAIL